MVENPRHEILLLGRDHSTYGTYAQHSQHGGRTSCVISCGADPLSPSRAFKASEDVPNEDALLAIDAGSCTLLAVSDAHFGHRASHDVLERLRELSEPLPQNPLALLDLVRHCTVEHDNADEDASATTLCVAVLDRATGQGFGASFGDSSLVLVGREVSYANRKNDEFVTPRLADSLDPRRAAEFAFAFAPGDLILCFTDGIDECHYRNPDTSVTLQHMQMVSERNDAVRYARVLTELALNGIDGHPGGQDNIALIATCS